MVPSGSWAEVALALVMIGGTGYAIWSRMRPRREDEAEGSPRGVGARFIQLIALLVILPLTGILSLEGKLSGEATASLIGVAIGYTLSGIEKAVPSKPSKKSKTPNAV